MTTLIKFGHCADYKKQELQADDRSALQLIQRKTTFDVVNAFYRPTRLYVSAINSPARLNY